MAEGNTRALPPVQHDGPLLFSIRRGSELVSASEDGSSPLSTGVDTIDVSDVATNFCDRPSIIVRSSLAAIAS